MTKFSITGILPKTNIKNVDILLLTGVLIIPFIYHLHNLAPETKVWKNSFFIVESGNYESVRHLFWFFFVKFYTLIIISIWFISAVSKWKYVLFFPIFFEISKILYLFFRIENDFQINFFILETSIAAIPYFFFLTFLSKQILPRNEYIHFLNEVNMEIGKNDSKLIGGRIKDYGKYKSELINLKISKNLVSKKEYLAKLIQLRDEILG